MLTVQQRALPRSAPSEQPRTVHRLNLANRITDQARALMPARDNDRRPYRLLLNAIEVEPSFVNAYATLGDWFRQHGEDPILGLMRVWEERGLGDEGARLFIEEYRVGDPAVRFAELCERRSCGPALIVRVAGRLDYLDLYDYEGLPGRLPALIGRVDHPRLICSLRDFGGLPAAKQAIAEDAIKRGKDFRIVSHRETTVHLANRTVFGPAIDTLYYNAALHETIYRSELATRAQRVAEVGVASGFLLASVIGALGRRPLEIEGSDIDPSALQTARANVDFARADLSNPAGVDVRLRHTPNLLSRMPREGVDLLLTNPPYIPELRYSGENAYSGTRLLEQFVVEEAPRALAPGGAAVVLFSSLASVVTQGCLERTPLVPIPLAAPRRVPLDLREVGRDARWVELLQRDHGLETRLGDPSHAYWHTLHVIALCRSEDRALIDELRSLAAANGAPALHTHGHDRGPVTEQTPEVSE